MKMEVLAVQQQYQYQQYGGLGSNKIRDWTSTLTPSLSVIATSPTAVTAKNNSTSSSTTTSSSATAAAATATTTTTTTSPMTVKTSAAVAAAMNANNNINSSSTMAIPYPHLYHHHHHHNLHHHHRQMATTNKMKNSIINKKSNRTAVASTNKTSTSSPSSPSSPSTTTSTTTNTNTNTSSSNSNSMTTTSNSNNFFYCDNNEIDAAAVAELSLRLLNELRAAKSRHLTCTEVSLPCDLTPSIAAEIIRVSEKEPCGIRGCTIYIEFEDEPNNSRRIASLKLDPETVSTFEVYLTLKQDHRGWTALLPQFMKNLARTITISPEFTITKHKLYSQNNTAAAAVVIQRQQRSQRRHRDFEIQLQPQQQQN